MDGIDEAGGDGDLCGEVEGLGGPADGVAQQVGVADVADFDLHEIAVGVSEPLEVAFDAGAGEVVEEEDGLAGGEDAVGEVGADEPGAAGDEDGSVGAGVVDAFAEPVGVAEGLDSAVAPEAEEEFFAAVAAFESEVVFAFVGVEAIDGGQSGVEVVAGVPVDALDGCVEGIDEGGELAAFVVTPGGIAGFGDPDFGIESYWSRTSRMRATWGVQPSQ